MSRNGKPLPVRGEFFAAIRPATTFVEVKGFINREWLVEVEVDCVEDP